MIQVIPSLVPRCRYSFPGDSAITPIKGSLHGRLRQPFGRMIVSDSRNDHEASWSCRFASTVLSLGVLTTIQADNQGLSFPWL